MSRFWTAGKSKANVIANFALLESTVLSVSRLPLTMAEDGYFHRKLKWDHHSLTALE